MPRLILLLSLISCFVFGEEVAQYEMFYKKFDPRQSKQFGSYDPHVFEKAYVIDISKVPLGQYQLVFRNCAFNEIPVIDLFTYEDGSLYFFNRGIKTPLSEYILFLGKFYPGESHIAEIYKGTYIKGKIPFARCEIAPNPLKINGPNGMELELMFYGLEKNIAKVTLLNFPSNSPIGLIMTLGEEYFAKVLYEGYPTQFCMMREPRDEISKARLIVLHETLDNPLEINFEW